MFRNECYIAICGKFHVDNAIWKPKASGSFLVHKLDEGPDATVVQVFAFAPIVARGVIDSPDEAVAFYHKQIRIHCVVLS